MGISILSRNLRSFHESLALLLIWCVTASALIYEETKPILEPPIGFPYPDYLKITKFVNWGDDIMIENVWTFYPRSALDIVEVANWGLATGYKIRASGHMHTWTPLTIGQRDLNSTENFVYNNAPARLIMVKTSEYMTRIKVFRPQRNSGPSWNIPEPKSRSGYFWAEPGISLFNLTKILEENNLGFLTHPATGTITLGGILAIGGHGAGVPAVDEKKIEGQTYGTLSNLIISLTAIVYDEEIKGFTLKSFHRSEPETKAFLVNLGRMFITNVTMRVGPLQYVACESRVDVKDEDLFAHPNSKSVFKFSNFLDESGRVEAILFPFTNRPWLKIWTVVDTQHPAPRGWYKTGHPYNYFFSENIPKDIALAINDITVSNNTPKAVFLGNAIYKWVAANLQNPRTGEIWGASRNSMLYVKASTLRMTANGYAILTARSQVQRVIHETYTAYNYLLHLYKNETKFPINGPLEIRVSGIDDPSDVGIEGAEAPALSAILPNEYRPDFDTVVWVDVLTFARTPGINIFMKDFEDFLVQTFHASCDYGRLRVEWSKGWGYTSSRPWSNDDFLTNVVPSTFPSWTETLNIFKKYDPFEVFTNSFLRLLLK